MVMLGALLYGAMSAVCGLGRAVDNERTKINTTHVNEKGQTEYYDRNCCRYINNEKVYKWTEHDKYGNAHVLTIGMSSGHVYNDTWDKIMAEDERKTKESYEDAIRRGELSYTDYCDCRFASNSGVIKEISTGKVINCLDEVYNLTTRKTEYRKWYVTEAALKEHGKYAYKNTAKGDYGIVITKEEYWKLGGKCAFNMAHTPTDRIVWEKLYGIGGAHE